MREMILWFQFEDWTRKNQLMRALLPLRMKNGNYLQKSRKSMRPWLSMRTGKPCAGR